MDMSNLLYQERFTPQSGQALYLQIAALIHQLIRRHKLAPGTKLPPERDLSSALAVSRTTAINAYRHLEQEGWVTTRVGSGTYVRYPAADAAEDLLPPAWAQLANPRPQSPISSLLHELIAAAGDPSALSLAAGMPDPALYPHATFQSLLVQGSPSPLDWGHTATEGYYPLREAIADRQRRKGHTVTPDEVMVLTGSQQGLDLIGRAFLQPGDTVLVENPTYLGAIQSFRHLGVKLLTIPCETPFPFAALESLLLRHRPKLFYTVPNFHNPTGRTLSLPDRQQLLQLAARHQFILIEDDPYGELYFQQPPPPSLRALAPHGGVLHLGTFSKILAPGLRVGWLEGPEWVIRRLALEKQYVDLHSANLTQWLVQQLLSKGLLDDHLRYIRGEYKKRRDVLLRTLRRSLSPELTMDEPTGGFFLWCRLKAPVTAQRWLHDATRQQVSFVPGAAFYADDADEQTLRLCYAAQSLDNLSEAARRLERSLRQLLASPLGQRQGSAHHRPIL